jgi:F-box protein 9
MPAVGEGLAHGAYLTSWRPWMALYGVRLKQQHDVRSAVHCAEIGRTRHSAVPADRHTPDPAPPQGEPRALSLIETLLPDEMLVAVFARLPVASLGAAQCVCRQWRCVGGAPTLWAAACGEAFQRADAATNARLLRTAHRGCWRDMFLDRTHLRFDGCYVSRNTYIRQGVAEWRVRQAVHMVCYYRYFRFLPGGSFAYRTSPEPVAKVARSLLAPPPAARPARRPPGAPPPVQHGRWRLDGARLLTALQYENSASTEVRCRLRVRSTVRGAYNRLDVDSIVSYDREDGTAVPLASAAAAAEEELAAELAGAERRDYTRGLATYVFVPWERVASSVLNLPVDRMDVFISG